MNKLLFWLVNTKKRVFLSLSHFVKPRLLEQKTCKWLKNFEEYGELIQYFGSKNIGSIRFLEPNSD